MCHINSAYRFFFVIVAVVIALTLSDQLKNEEKSKTTHRKIALNNKKKVREASNVRDTLRKLYDEIVVITIAIRQRQRDDRHFVAMLQ